MITPKINSFFLDNNLKVIHSNSSSVPIVSIQLYVKIGSCWEQDEEAGYSHFMEHLVFKSTQKFPENKIMNESSNLGGFLNAYTEFDSTCFYITLHSDHAEKGFDIISQLGLHTNFSDQDFYSERKVVFEEMKEHDNDPENKFLQSVPEKYFTNNPFKKSIIGNLDVLNAAKPDDLRKFYHDKYRPSNCFIVVTGDLTLQDVKDLSNKYFGDWQDKKVTLKTVDKLDDNRKVVETNESTLKDDFLCFVLPDVSEMTDEAYPMNVIMKYFALGKDSKLFNRLCIQEKIAHHVRVHSYTGVYPGIMMIMVYPKDAGKIEEIVRIFNQELRLLRNNGIGNNDLNRIKNNLLVSFGYSYEFMEGFASALGAEEINGDYRHFERYEAGIEEVNKNSINSCLEKYVNFENLSLFHLGPKKIGKNISNMILKNSPKTNNTFGDLYQTTLDNGLKIVFKRVLNKPTIGIAVTNAVSQLNETTKTRGVNYLSVSAMLRGTKKKSYQQLIEYSHNNGIQITVSPGMEFAAIRAKCFSDDIYKTIELLAEVTYEPVYVMEEVENLKSAIAQELRKIKDYPERYASSLWKKMVFGKESNLLNKTGSLSTFNKISRKQVFDWYADNLNHKNMTLTIVGDFHFQNVLETIKYNFSRENKTDSTNVQKPIIQSSANHFQKKILNNNQGIIHIGGFACKALNTVENTSFHVLSQILGGESNSRLFDVLREKHGMGYSVDFDYLSTRKVGNWVTSAIVDKKVIGKAEKLILQTLEDVKKNGITNDELMVAKNSLKGNRIFEQESVLTQASYISALITLGYDYEYYMNREKRIDNVQKDKIMEIARKYFVEDNYWIQILE